MAISLVKGQKISLKKDSGHKLTSFCVGANWGMITTEKMVVVGQETVVTKKGFLGFGREEKVRNIKKMREVKEAVDLDLSVGLFDSNKTLVDTVSFQKLQTSGVFHSGDDREGDADGDDGLDNEVVQVDLNKIASNVDQIVFVLDSYLGQDFAEVPFASIRLYDGTPEKVNKVVAAFNVSNDSKVSGFVSMILGKLYKHNGEWKFSAIGEPTRETKLEGTLRTVQQRYL